MSQMFLPNFEAQGDEKATQPPCSRCGGTGVTAFTHVVHANIPGGCFRCNGSGVEPQEKLSLAVVGSRSLADEEKFASNLEQFIKGIDKPLKEIVSGGAKGADTFAKNFANANDIPLVEYYPNWKLGRDAGFRRNTQIVSRANVVIAFWDGESPGTRNTIAQALERNMLVYIVDVTQPEWPWAVVEK